MPRSTTDFGTGIAVSCVHNLLNHVAEFHQTCFTDANAKANANWIWVNSMNAESDLGLHLLAYVRRVLFPYHASYEYWLSV